jgi:hypothetical protein
LSRRIALLLLMNSDTNINECSTKRMADPLKYWQQVNCAMVFPIQDQNTEFPAHPQ